jgi:hypothetical protein
MSVFRNRNWTKRNYECTNVVACEADEAPTDNWVPVDPAYLDALLNRGGQQLEICAGVHYYGWL